MRSLVKEKREVAKGTLLVVFDLLGRGGRLRPGQYFWVELPDRGYEDEKGLRRHISVVTSPNERGVLGLCTRLRDTAFKRSLAELRVGAEVEVEEPKGTTVLPEDTSSHYVFVAGGIGITVFRSMLRYIAEDRLPYRVTLVYSNRDRESTAFLDELQELERTLPELPARLDDDRRPGLGRREQADRRRRAPRPPRRARGSTYLVAGPPGDGRGGRGPTLGGGRARGAGPAGRFSGY